MTLVARHGAPGTKGRRYEIWDPLYGKRRWRLAELKQRWRGRAIVCTRSR